MRNFAKRIFAFFIVSALCLGWFGFSPASASFNKNLVISDNLFDKDSSMTSSQIDAFLNSFPSSCISTTKKFTAIDPTGYNPTNGFSYGGQVSAGRVIYDAAQAYDLNPQVILATLQKEQSLVSGTAGCSNLRYVGAMGYGCPDGGTTYNYSGANLYAINGHVVTSVSGTCVKAKEMAGFSQQVIRGAWLLKFGEQRSKGNVNWAIVRGNWNNSDDPPTFYGGPMTKGNFKRCQSCSTVAYDGYATIDSQSVFMGSGATAALYWYTPHLHGNQSFVSIYEGWFGSTQGLPDVVHPDGALVRPPNNNMVYLVQAGALRPVPNADVLFSYRYHWSDIKTATDPDIALSTASNLALREGAIVQGSDSKIYVVENHGSTYAKHAFSSWPVYSGLGYNSKDVLKVSNSSLPVTNGTDITSTTSVHPAGTLVRQDGASEIYVIQSNQLRHVSNADILFSYGYSWSDVKPANIADMALTIGSPLPFAEGFVLKGSSPNIYAVDIKNDGSSQIRAFSDWSIFTGLGYRTYKSVPNSELPVTIGPAIQ